MSDLFGLCSICGKPGAMFTCNLCGKNVCAIHYNSHHGICSQCSLGKI